MPPASSGRSSRPLRFSRIPTQLVTGFLGAGKTTLIRSLLDHKPEDERWAVLVNEFGQVGVDADLLRERGAFIELVPGGCLCCISRHVFDAALARLMRRVTPQRILIEPSGLGHPATLLRQLGSGSWRTALDLRATLTLVDARQLADPRYRQHPIFRQQIEVSDVLLGSKADGYGEADRRRFQTLAESLRPPRQRVALIEWGNSDAGWLDLPCLVGCSRSRAEEALAAPVTGTLPQTTGVDEASSWRCHQGVDGGWHALGWTIPAGCRFPRQPLLEWLDGLAVERLKGVFRLTGGGGLAVNRVTIERSVEPAADIRVSRLQLIDTKALDATRLDRQLRALAVCTPEVEDNPDEMP